MQELQVSRVTASRYLNSLAEHKLLDKVKVGHSNFYLHPQLTQLLINHSEYDNTDSFEIIASIMRGI